MCCRLARAVLVLMAIFQVLHTAYLVLCAAREMCTGVAVQTSKIVGFHAGWSLYTKITRFIGIQPQEVVTTRFTDALMLSLKTADYSQIAVSWIGFAVHNVALRIMQ